MQVLRLISKGILTWHFASYRKELVTYLRARTFFLVGKVLIYYIEIKILFDSVITP